MSSNDKSYGYLGVDMPRHIALRMALLQRAIPKEDLYTEKGGHGLERHPHVTVAYGHEEDDTTSTKEALADMIAGEGSIGGLGTFDNPDYQVLKFDVDSDHIRTLNSRLRERIAMPGNTFKDYNPHVTVAYLKPGADVSRYTKLERLLKGQRFPIKQLRFGNPADKYTTLVLADKIDEIQKTAADVVYRIRPGSKRYKDLQGERRSISTTRALASIDGEEVGSAELLNDFHGKKVLRALKVLAAHRKKGIGRGLMKKILEEAGEGDVYLRANPYDDEPMSREALMKFYGEYGFKPINNDAEPVNGQHPVGSGPGAMLRKKDALRKVAKIVLDIDVGDTVLVGRFKNKKVTVESIGTDENGQPTINGRKLLALRIQKLMPKSGPVAATTAAAASRYGTLRKKT